MNKDDLISASHLKKRILVQDRDGSGFQTGGIRLYVEDLKPGSNKDIGPKDFLVMACKAMVVLTLLSLWLIVGMQSDAAANTTVEELQRKNADITLLKQQLGDRMIEAESALEALLKQQNSLLDEVHLLIKSLKIKSFEDAQRHLRLRNDMDLLKTMAAYRRAFEEKIRFYQTGRNKLTYLQQLAEDDTRMVSTLSDFQIDALATQVSLVINQYLDDAHSVQIDPQKVDTASAQSIWEAISSGK